MAFRLGDILAVASAFLATPSEEVLEQLAAVGLEHSGDDVEAVIHAQLFDVQDR